MRYLSLIFSLYSVYSFGSTMCLKITVPGNMFLDSIQAFPQITHLKTESTEMTLDQELRTKNDLRLKYVPTKELADFFVPSLNLLSAVPESVLAKHSPFYLEVEYSSAESQPVKIAQYNIKHPGMFETCFLTNGLIKEKRDLLDKISDAISGRKSYNKISFSLKANYGDQLHTFSPEGSIDTPSNLKKIFYECDISFENITPEYFEVKIFRNQVENVYEKYSCQVTYKNK